MELWNEFFKLLGHFAPPVIVILVIAFFLTKSIETVTSPRKNKRR